jgi:hypothetical protein
MPERGRVTSSLGRARGLVTALFLAASVVAGPRAQGLRFQEVEVKAAFLFNFAQFVTWPETAFATPQAPFVIGILGDDPFGKVLDDVVSGEAVAGHRLVVARFRRIEDVESCHVLFVAALSPAEAPQLFAKLTGAPVLTVGDADAFTAGGGMIGFRTERNRIRLRVNLAAASAAHLTISSNLLRGADIVGQESRP